MQGWLSRYGLRIYVALFVFAGTAAALRSLYLLFFNGVQPQWFLLLLLTLVSGTAVLKIPGIPANFTISDTFTITAAVLYGPAAGTLVVALDCLVISFRLARARLPKRQVMFNATAPAFAMWVTAHILPRIDAGAAVSGVHFALPLTLFTASYFALNTGTIAFAIALEKRLSPLAVWRVHFLGLWMTYFGGGVAAGLVFLLTHTTNANPYVALVAVLVPLPLVYYAFKHAMGRLDDQLHHLADLNTLYLSTIEALAQAIDAKDHFTHGHIRRVQMYAVRLARELGVVDEADLKAIEAAALLHDMGKIGVPEHILNKPGKLTSAEYEKVKVHAALGADILSSIKFPYPVVPIVRHHHERWDGRGYPDGLAGTNIPLGARILSVADCFDALTTDRPYRPALSDEAAVAVLLDDRGESYDPVVVDAFVRVFREVAVHEAVPVLPAGTVDAIARTFHAAPAAADLRPTAVYDEAAPAFFDAGAALATADSTDGVGRAVWACARRMMPASSCVLYLSDGTGDTLHVAFAGGEHARELSHLALPLGHRLSGWVAANRSTMVNADALLDLAALSVVLNPPLHSCVSSPVLEDGRILGALTLYSTKTSPFSDRHGRLLEALAARIALALVRIQSRAA